MSSMASLIDPHAHTLHSDGTDTPEGLVLAAKRAGLDVVGITDHDTTQGWAEAVEAARRHGVGLLRGVEVSAVYQGNSVHILGYLMDPQDHSLNLLFEDARRTKHAPRADGEQPGCCLPSLGLGCPQEKGR